MAAHTRQGRRGALARSDRLTADLGSPVTPMLAHILAWRRRDRHLSIQKRCGGCMPVTAHTRQGRRRAMAWSDRLIADLGSTVTPMLAHILAWRRRHRFLSIQKRCGGCMPVAAHTWQGRRRAMVRFGMLAADLGSPISPMLALIFACVVYATEFRPFRNCAGAACPWPRTLGKGVGEHWRGLTG